MVKPALNDLESSFETSARSFRNQMHSMYENPHLSPKTNSEHFGSKMLQLSSHKKSTEQDVVKVENRIKKLLREEHK